ncbi:MAG: stage III sporulation protein AG [Lachnospiraceae bacterium]|nr:stage III sporulation protein AG [Robinsoniella sp.]MDY3766493.1 stage III sporulation protein AG [Lachnospiraceae bacterium]
MESRWEAIRERIKNGKKDQLLIWLLVGALIIVIVLPTDSSGSKNVQEKTESVDGEDTISDAKEQRLAEVLSQVEGVGKTQVMITYRSSGEKIVEKDLPVTERTVNESDDQGGNSSTVEREQNEETIYEKGSDGSQTPYVVKVTEPEIAGVLIVAEGGGDPVIAKNITEAVIALFGVEAHKIKVMKMN